MDFLRPEWPAPSAVCAAMTTREGGVSRGVYATLNMGRSGGDDGAAVDENRRRAFAALNLPAEPSWIHQVHGAAVVRAPFLPSATPDADACFTTDPGVVCVVQSADCLPVLFCDREGTMVAAAHAGWRGLAAGVLENTVRAMPAPATQLMAWLGAAIGPQAFEVGAEVRSAFVDDDPAAAAEFSATGNGKFKADLYGLARRRLCSAGVGAIYGGGLCTHSDAQRFFSYRRDQSCGRMAALIWMRPHCAA